MHTAQYAMHSFLDKESKSSLKPRNLGITFNVNLIALMGIYRPLRFSGLLGGLDLLVQTDQDLSEPEASSDCDSKHSYNDSVRLPEAVFGHLPDIRSSDVSELGESVDHGDSDSSFCRRSRERGTDQTVKHDESCVGTGLEEECDISGGDDFGADRNNETYETKADGTDNVPELIVRG